MTNRVSYFTNVKLQKTKDICISDFLNLVKNQTFNSQILEIRNAPTKEQKLHLKLLLPCITVSGTFNHSHRNNDLTQHSGLIQIDIDNLPIGQISGIRKRLSADKYVLAYFISPSGTGLKIIFRINADTGTHLQSYLAIEKYFLTVYDLQIDKACKDVSRPMFLSSDKDLYYNENAEIFCDLLETKDKIKADRYFNASENTFKDEFFEVSTICNRIVSSKNDITYGYENWIKLGFALANLGENGRQFFHQLSELHPNYIFSETDKQFSNCLKNKNSGVTLKSFFYMAKNNGINIKI